MLEGSTMPDDITPDLMNMISENFSAMDSAIVVALIKKDERYAELAKKHDELSDRFPDIEKWLKQEGPLTLSADEHAGLIEHLEVTSYMEDLERMAIYYAGHKDCFEYLKKIGVI